MTVTACAAVTTATANRYLTQLCKHFAHKISVEYDDHHGRADFPGGACHLSAEGETLSLRCEAADERDLERIKMVVADHLLRFGWRESLTVVWGCSP